MTRLEKICIGVMGGVLMETSLMHSKDRTALIMVGEYGMEPSAADALCQKVYDGYMEAYSK